MNLPVIVDGVGDVALIECATGELVALRDASDHAIAHAASELAEIDGRILQFKRSLAAELRSRHGVGTVHAGGFDLTVAESQSWPVGAVKDALTALSVSNTITEADAERCLPLKPKPDGRQIKALISRLTVTDPVAAKVLADACTVSAPSLREIRRVAVEEASS